MFVSNPALNASPPELREREIVPSEPERLVAFQAQVQAEDPELGMFIWVRLFWRDYAARGMRLSA